MTNKELMMNKMKNTRTNNSPPGVKKAQSGTPGGKSTASQKQTPVQCMTKKK
jgi:hypothetical protein